jgi:hypothetical protein
MAQRKKSPGTSGVGVLKELGFFGGGITPFQQAAQYALSQSPESFDYSELDQKYPTRQVRPMIPTYIQQEIDEDRIARKEKLANQRIREAQASIYESKLNEDIAAAEQVPLAREYFSKLNPQSADWPEQRDAGFAQFPLIENHTFAKSRIASMDRLYDNWAKKNIGTNMTIDDYGKAVKEIVDMERVAEDLGEELSPAQKKYRGLRISQMKQFESQQGVGGPVSPAQQPALVPTTEAQGNLSVKEGRIYRQGGKNYRYTNGQMVELP